MLRLDPLASASSHRRRRPEVVKEWRRSLKNERMSSLSIWAEEALLEARCLPLKQKIVSLVNVLKRISVLFVRFESVLNLIVSETISCVYAEECSCGEDDLYAKQTWQEKCLVASSQRDKFKNLIRSENENQTTIGNLKENLGTGFKCMLDPSTRLLRRFVFVSWSSRTRDRKSIRETLERRTAHRRKREVFDAFRSCVRLAKINHVLFLKQKIERDRPVDFSVFDKEYRRDAANALKIFSERAGQDDDDGGVAAVLRLAARAILIGSEDDEDRSQAGRSANDRQEDRERLLELFKLTDEK